MKIITLVAFIILLNSNIHAQASINLALKKQLDSVWRLDQKYREILSNDIPDSVEMDSISKSLNVSPKNINNALWKLQNFIDSCNLVFVEKVFARYGYPGKTLVGPETCEAAWSVLQHSTKIDKYINLIKKAAEKSELPFRLYATMYDRYLVNNKKEQIYGTQIVLLQLKNGQNGWFVWPMKKPGKVNELRRNAEFNQSVEENAKRLGVKFRIIKMSEIKL